MPWDPLGLGDDPRIRDISARGVPKTLGRFPTGRRTGPQMYMDPESAKSVAAQIAEITARQRRQDFGRSQMTGARTGRPRPVGSSSQAGQRIPGGGLPYDAEAIQEIQFIKDMLANRITEYEQQRQVNEVDAERERIPIRRDIGIQQDYGPLAQQGVSTVTEQLLADLNRVIPLTEGIYNQGTAAVSEGYNSGAAAIANQIAGNSDLARQLMEISGSPGTLEQDMEGTAEFMRNLLNASGAAGAASLGATGSGEMEAIRNSLGGYNTEAETINNRIALQTAAAIQQLQQELAMVTPDFLPFNYGAMQLQANMDITDAIRRGTERSTAEREEAEAEKRSRQRYTGLEGAELYARERGRPELVNELQQMMADAQMNPDVDPDAALALLMRDYDPREFRDITVGGGSPQPEGSLVEQVGRGFGALLDLDPGSTIFNANPRTGGGYLKQGRWPIGAKPDEQSLLRDRQLLQDLLTIMQGNYSNYAD